MKNAHEFPNDLYDDLVDFRKAGYVMIDVESPFIRHFDTDLQYFTPDPDKYWMRGLLNSWHVTARGPMLPNVRQSHVKTVLADMELPDTLFLGDLEVFPSPYPDEPYDCIVFAVKDQRLFDINTQLGVLPNITTYIPYKPHITIGYFQSGHTEELMEAIYASTDAAVKVRGYDYGRMAE